MKCAKLYSKRNFIKSGIWRANSATENHLSSRVHFEIRQLSLCSPSLCIKDPAAPALLIYIKNISIRFSWNHTRWWERFWLAFCQPNEGKHPHFPEKPNRCSKKKNGVRRRTRLPLQRGRLSAAGLRVAVARLGRLRIECHIHMLCSMNYWVVWLIFMRMSSVGHGGPAPACSVCRNSTPTRTVRGPVVLDFSSAVQMNPFSATSEDFLVGSSRPCELVKIKYDRSRQR